MNNQEMLDFLMEHDVILLSTATKKELTADEAYELGGEFVVYSQYGSELYRGNDLDNALKELEC